MFDSIPSLNVPPVADSIAIVLSSCRCSVNASALFGSAPITKVVLPSGKAPVNVPRKYPTSAHSHCMFPIVFGGCTVICGDESVMFMTFVEFVQVVGVVPVAMNGVPSDTYPTFVKSSPDMSDCIMYFFPIVSVPDVCWCMFWLAMALYCFIAIGVSGICFYL